MRQLDSSYRHGLLPFFLPVILVVGACGNSDPPPTVDPELADALGLDPDEVVYQIRLTGRGAQEWLAPAHLEVPAGALVEFVTTDRRIHTVTFIEDSLSSAAVEFLEETRQRASPPLVEQGSRFVVTFEGAPEGRYPFKSGSHGEVAVGSIMVGSR